MARKVIILKSTRTLILMMLVYLELLFLVLIVYRYYFLLLLFVKEPHFRSIHEQLTYCCLDKLLASLSILVDGELGPGLRPGGSHFSAQTWMVGLEFAGALGEADNDGVHCRSDNTHENAGEDETHKEANEKGHATSAGFQVQVGQQILIGHGSHRTDDTGQGSNTKTHH